MIRVYVVVEGKTEAVFVDELLAPRFWPLEIYLTPILLGTSGHKGGNTKFDRAQRHLVRLLKTDGQAYCTTMFDYYALGKGFPGAHTGGPLQEQVARIEREWKRQTCFEVPDGRADVRFIPHLCMHEFEALLFSDPFKLAQSSDIEKAGRELQAVREAFPSPEDINDSPDTAPSKRIARAIPGYDKVFDGIRAAEAIGIAKMQQECPHFRQWIEQLLAITPIP